MNLLEAVTVRDPNAKGRGVMVVLNDRIGSARFVTKINATTLIPLKRRRGLSGVNVNGQQIQFETRVEKSYPAICFDAMQYQNTQCGDYLRIIRTT